MKTKTVLSFVGLLAVAGSPIASDTTYDSTTGELVTRRAMPVSVVFALCRGYGFAEKTCGKLPAACPQGSAGSDLLPRLCLPTDTSAVCDAKLDLLLPRDAVPAGVCPSAAAGAAWDETCRTEAVKKAVRPRATDPNIPELGACLVVIDRHRARQESLDSPFALKGRRMRHQRRPVHGEDPGGQ